MSTSGTNSQRQDAVNNISARLTLVLLNNQELDFSKLRRLALLTRDTDNFEVYCELIVLSFIKYLSLDRTFSFEIQQDRDAYRIFNAMNLNEDKINAHFCIFLSIVAPDIVAVLASVTAQIARELADDISSQFTRFRLKEVENKVNNFISNGSAANQISYSRTSNHVVNSSELSKRTGRLSLTEYLAGVTPRSKIHRRRRSSVAEVKSSNSKNSIETYSGFLDNTKRVQSIRLGSSEGSDIETASATSRRLYAKRRADKESIPDAAFDPIPEKLKAGDASKYLDEEASSVVF